MEEERSTRHGGIERPKNAAYAWLTRERGCKPACLISWKHAAAPMTRRIWVRGLMRREVLRVEIGGWRGSIVCSWKIEKKKKKKKGLTIE